MDNPSIAQYLGINTNISEPGLIGADETGETVLRMRNWVTDYLGDSLHDGINHEIPGLKGSELIIGRDYFERMCELFEVAPSHVSVKFEGVI